MLRHGPLGHDRTGGSLNTDANGELSQENHAEHSHDPQNAANLPPNTANHAHKLSYSVQPIPPPADVPYSSAASGSNTPDERSISEAPTDEDSSMKHDSSTMDDEETFVYEGYDAQELTPGVLRSIFSYEKLKKLSLKGNYLQSLPKSLNLLSSTLYYLNLSHNHFETVPDVVCELQSLEILDMSNNNLRVLSPQLAKLPHLMGLSLVNNKFEVLPPVIADLPKLEILELEENPIRLPQNVPEMKDAPDPETWVDHIKELILKNRPLLTQALGARQERPLDRSMSVSEMNMNMRNTKRMGFVMSRNASDQSYVANLHARGMSHDAHMLDSIAHENSASPEPSYAHASVPDSAGVSSPTPAPAPAPASGSGSTSASATTSAGASAGAGTGGNENHERTASANSSLAGNSDDFMSPVSPNLSPRAEISGPAGLNLASATNSERKRLDTLAEERDPDETLDTDIDSSPIHPRMGSGGSFSASQVPSREPSPLSVNTDLARSPAGGGGPYTPLTSSGLLTPGFGPLSGFSRSNSNSDSNSPSAVDSPLENLHFVFKEFGDALSKIAFALPVSLLSTLGEAQELLNANKCAEALNVLLFLVEKLSMPAIFGSIIAQISKRQQRQFASTIMLTYPELESAYQTIQRSIAMPPLSVSSAQPQAQDDQLHALLDVATKQAQSVLALLNQVVAKSASSAAHAGSSGLNSSAAAAMASRVRDLSAVCLRCNNSVRGVRQSLEQQASVHTRTRHLSERRRFWEEVNGFLKSVVATLAAVKSALPDVPLLADSKVSSVVADLTRMVKEIPPLLEQSSYWLLLESGQTQSTDTDDLYVNPAVMQQAGYQANSTAPSAAAAAAAASSLPGVTPGGQLQLQMQMFFNSQAQSQASLPPPTPLTATLGPAAQALVSPNERQERSNEGYIQYGLRKSE